MDYHAVKTSHLIFHLLVVCDVVRPGGARPPKPPRDWLAEFQRGAYLLDSPAQIVLVLQGPGVRIELGVEVRRLVPANSVVLLS